MSVVARNPAANIMIVLLYLTLIACKPAEDSPQVSTAIQPPVATKIPKTLTIHNDKRTDNYYWIRDDDRKYQRVLDLLARENEYTRQVMAHAQVLQDSRFEE